MAKLTLTDDEVTQARMLVGNRLSTDELTSSQIRSEIICGEASDYVFEKVRENINIEALDDTINITTVDGTPVTERDIAEDFRDETEVNISNFIDFVLKPPQRNMMRRAIVYRIAGNCMPIVYRVERESGSEISREVERRRWQDLQAEMYGKADEQIGQILLQFPDDAFPRRKVVKHTLFAATRC